ncbi:MAG: hypothetical protein ABIQ09_00445 [Jatrophihabitantaceae bacterium]
MDEAAREELKDEQPRTPQISAIRLILGVFVALATFTGQLPPRPVVVFAAFIVVGAWFWKAPPFDVGPRVGLVNGFLPATMVRTVTAAREVGGWAVGFGVWGVISGALVALMRTGEPVAENCRIGAMWGLLGGALVGAMVWAGQQAARDVETLRVSQERAHQDRPDQDRPDQDRVGPDRVGPDRVGPDRVNQDWRASQDD